MRDSSTTITRQVDVVADARQSDGNRLDDNDFRQMSHLIAVDDCDVSVRPAASPVDRPRRVDDSAGPGAAAFFADGSLAWVHLDARHDYDSVVTDIKAWVPNVQPGGWLSGDDYDSLLWPGVVAAVRDELPDASGWLSVQWRWTQPG